MTTGHRYRFGFYDSYLKPDKIAAYKVNPGASARRRCLSVICTQ